MQAVILAAGRGKRMGELTNLVPKPMLLVHGKSLLAHKIDSLPRDIDQIIFVIGYQGSIIRRAFGNEYRGRHIQYVEQAHLDGTMGALKCAAPLITGRFIVMMGDDLYGTEEVQTACATPDFVVVVKKTDDMASGGKVSVDEHDVVIDIEEGEHHGTSGLMNTNLFVLDERIFDYEMVPKKEGSKEYGLPQTVNKVSMKAQIPLHAVYATSWIQITAPEDIAVAEAVLAP